MSRQIFKKAHNKEMSLVVGIKCTDGVTIGSDSLVSYMDGSKKICTKIIKTDELIAACFNCLSVKLNNKWILINELLEKMLFKKADFDFLKAILKEVLLKQDANQIYEFLVAYKETPNVIRLKHLRCFNGIIKGEEKDLNSFVLHTPNGIMNLTIEKPLKVKEAEVIIENVIKNTIELQKYLMNDIYADNPVLTYSLAYTHTHEG